MCTQSEALDKLQITIHEVLIDDDYQGYIKEIKENLNILIQQKPKMKSELYKYNIAQLAESYMISKEKNRFLNAVSHLSGLYGEYLNTNFEVGQIQVDISRIKLTGTTYNILDYLLLLKSDSKLTGQDILLQLWVTE